jgi:hypothetical protein
MLGVVQQIIGVARLGHRLSPPFGVVEVTKSISGPGCASAWAAICQQARMALS